MHDQPGGVVEDLTGERIALGGRLPRRPDAPRGDVLGEPARLLPAVALHRGEVRAGVSARERQPRD